MGQPDGGQLDDIIRGGIRPRGLHIKDHHIIICQSLQQQAVVVTSPVSDRVHEICQLEAKTPGLFALKLCHRPFPDATAKAFEYPLQAGAF